MEAEDVVIVRVEGTATIVVERVGACEAAADFVEDTDDDAGDADSRACGGGVGSERGSASLPPLLSSLLLRRHLCS